jgi:hypothetical protein
VCCGDFGEVAVRSTIDVRDGNDVRSYGQGLEDVGCGCGAGAVGERIAGVFERCNCLLEVVSVGVGGARVLVYAYGLANGILRESS